MKTKFINGKQLLDEAIRLQVEFKKNGTHWSLVECVDSIVDNETNEVRPSAIKSAKTIALSVDKTLTK
jgi:hypothetical protein